MRDYNLDQIVSLNDGSELVNVGLYVVELWASDDYSTPTQQSRLEGGKSHRDAIGCDQQAGPLQHWSRWIQKAQLHRPVSQR